MSRGRGSSRSTRRAALAVPGVRLILTAADLPQPMPRFGPAVPGPAGHRGRRDALPRRAGGGGRGRDDGRRRGGRRGSSASSTRSCRRSSRSPRPSTRARRSSRTRRCARATRWRPRTSCASTTTAGAMSTPRRPTSWSRGRTGSRWSPSSRSSHTPSWRPPTATGSRSGARSSTRTGCSGSSPACSACRCPRSGSSRPDPGGGFGGKQHAKYEPLVAFLALRAGRPVRLVLTLEETFQAVRRGASEIRVRSGFSDRRPPDVPRRPGRLPRRGLRGHRRPDGRQGQLHLGRAVSHPGDADRGAQHPLAHDALDRVPRLRQPAADLGGRIEHGRGRAGARHRPARASAAQPGQSGRGVHPRRHPGRRRLGRDRPPGRRDDRVGESARARVAVGGWRSA